MTNRPYYASRVEQLGQQINQLRQDLLQQQATFSAGLVRAAEEAILVVFTALQDTTVPEGDL